jgi:hypothetical protein
MRPQECMALIWELEQCWAVDGLRVGGVDLWPITRNRIASALRAQGRDPAPAVEAAPRGMRKLSNAIAAQRQAARVDREHNADPSQRANVLVLHHSAYRSLAGGAYYDRLLDYLREELARRGIASLGLEYSPSGAFRTPRAWPTRYIQSELHYANLRNRVFGGISGAKVKLPAHYQALGRAVQQTGIAAPVLAPQTLARQAGLLNRWAALFTHYLKSSGAQLVLTTYYYSMEGMALCLAARRLGIPCVDVQHGVQGRYHFAYGPWHCALPGGYNTLPTLFWCWDAESASQIDAWAMAQGAHALAGGNPWQALWEGADTPAAQRELARIDAVRMSQPARRHILLSLQWDAGLSAELRALIAASPAGWHWWVRPHPVQAGGHEAVRAALEQCAPARYELDLAADTPLPLLLMRLDAHVTRSSTVVREAAQAGLRSAVLDPAARDLYGAELDSGLAVAADSTADALAALEHILAEVPPARRPKPQPGMEPRTGPGLHAPSHRALVSAALDELCALALLDAGRSTLA